MNFHDDVTKFDGALAGARPAPERRRALELAEAHEQRWRGRSEWEIRAEQERAITRRLTRVPR